jgi:predicted Zn-dependent protease
MTTSRFRSLKSPRFSLFLLLCAGASAGFAAETRPDGCLPPGEGASYRVGWDIRTLSEISAYLYGTAKKYTQIAQWNGIAAPYKIRQGQCLKLKEAPRMTPEQGLAEVQRRRGESPSVATVAPQPILIPLPFKKNEEATEKQLDQGEKALKDGHYSHAIEVFHAAREQDPESVAAWLFEIQALNMSHHEADARELARRLVSKQDELKEIPYLQKLLGKSSE